MSDNITLRIFTPAGLEREEVISSATLPSSMGEIGILPGHAQYVGMLGTGILKFIRVSGSAEEKLVVSEGICRFENNALDILADKIFTSAEALPDNIAAKKSELEKILVTTESSASEWIGAKVELARIDALERFRSIH